MISEQSPSWIRHLGFLDFSITSENKKNDSKVIITNKRMLKLSKKVKVNETISYLFVLNVLRQKLITVHAYVGDRLLVSMTHLICVRHDFLLLITEESNHCMLD